MAAYQFTENVHTCPQWAMLQDGTWIAAPWMAWYEADQVWRCLICSPSGVRVTADHLATPKHQGRTRGQWNHLGRYTRGGLRIVDIWTDDNYENAAPLPLPAAPGAQPPLPAQPPQPAAPGLPLPAAAAPTAGEHVKTITDALEQHTKTITDAVEQLMQTKAEDTLRIETKFDDVCDRLQIVADRLQIVADRIAETNQLLGAAQPRGAVQAVRAVQTAAVPPRAHQ